MWRFLKILLVASLPAGAWLPAVAFAQEGGDLQAQILYAYHTEDSNRLADLMQNLAATLMDEPGDPALRYHRAHAAYRLGRLRAVADAQGAAEAFSACIDELKVVLHQDVKSVEALILQGACYGELAHLRSMESVLLRSRARDRLATASRLAPRNPRLLLVQSMQALAAARPASPEHRAALAQLNLAVQLFDASPATRIDAPGWGHAEAYLALGRELELSGDRVQARNLIEKALIAAPDFKAAQRELADLGRP